MLLYFAYGSNMSTARLRKRVPQAEPQESAVLRDRELRWHKRSKDGSAKCDAAAAPGAEVHGVLFRIPSVSLPALDTAEGCGYGYERERVVVETKGGPQEALTYLATRLDPSLPVYECYKTHVVRGAEEHHLPEDYRRILEAVSARPCPPEHDCG